MELSPLLLARIQFAVNLTFHILFPAINIALAWILLFFKLRWRATGDTAWLDAYRFWIRVFALSFALGVVSGLTMSFQFGTTFPGFMEKAGNVVGPLMGYEVMTAFFLEAGFLGIMLFGRGRVSERIHTLAMFLVAFGVTLSAFWILAANSWMQTPAGAELVDGKFYPTDWMKIVFSESLPLRFGHMVLASVVTAAFVVLGVSAWQGLRRPLRPGERKAFVTGLVLAAAVIPVQMLVGDTAGRLAAKTQPAKIAAIEGLWETQRGAGTVLIGWPDEATRSNKWAITLPYGASLLITHSLDGEVLGLNEFPNAHPPVAPVFFAFRVMAGVGVLMMLASWGGLWLLRARKWNPDALPRWALRLLAGMTFSGWVATVAGWYTAEIGRQPWVVYGLVRSSEVVADEPAAAFALSLTGFLLLYAFLLLSYVGTLIYQANKGIAPTLQHAPAADSSPAQGGNHE
ncbi:cytochrome ubiquinol oxidase subunit I [Bordetella sp. BOR01]|uniref:cytochrome ubiquinol oxidase subunit I n=1 Tax=Bordetella sp. BOR01 TaxID=2854779 RepID=UPI001C457821|nr:cytochrome ubiquinol oxidase subunit I [Bordetella sp. BOR01]MBV7483845.1 cytochrome ubiquinol oxidase subunit I [Bordetella sp. BOR01]